MQWGTEGDGDRLLCAAEHHPTHPGGMCCLCHRGAPRGAQAPTAGSSGGTQSKSSLPSSHRPSQPLVASLPALLSHLGEEQDTNTGVGRATPVEEAKNQAWQARKAMCCLGGASPSPLSLPIKKQGCSCSPRQISLLQKREEEREGDLKRSSTAKSQPPEEALPSASAGRLL